jgi:hypothetical protein
VSLADLQRRGCLGRLVKFFSPSHLKFRIYEKATYLKLAKRNVSEIRRLT